MGFEDMVNMAEEVKQPERTMPKAILLALIVSTTLYFLVALVAVLALPLLELQASDAPMVAILEPYSSSASNVIAMISLVAVVNGALLQLIMGSRVVYGMARQGMAPALFAVISDKTQTPIKATLFVGVLIWFFALALPLVLLAKITSFIVVIIFTLVNLAQVRLHIKEYGFAKRARAWVIPAMGCLLCLMFLAVQMILLFTGGTLATH